MNRFILIEKQKLFLNLKFKRPKKYDLSINITPLVDVVFLLLIFFIVTAVLERNSLIEVDLAKVAADTTESELAGIEVVVSADGEYFVNGVPIVENDEVNLENQLQRLSGRDTSLPVTLYVDGEVPHRIVVNVMSTVQKAGFAKLQLAGQVE